MYSLQLQVAVPLCYDPDGACQVPILQCCKVQTTVKPYSEYVLTSNSSVAYEVARHYGSTPTLNSTTTLEYKYLYLHIMLSIIRGVEP